MEEIKSQDLRQYLVFRLAGIEYGVDIRQVTTIIEKDMIIARVPKTPAFIKGVINLRGEIIPVMDLHIKFNLAEAEDTENTRIIIVRVEDIIVGLIVDSVAEVIYLGEDAVENVASFNSDLTMDYVYGVGKVNGRIVTLLNLEKLVSI